MSRELVRQVFEPSKAKPIKRHVTLMGFRVVYALIRLIQIPFEWVFWRLAQQRSRLDVDILAEEAAGNLKQRNH